MPLIPPCKWAQRQDKIFLTIELADAKDVKVDFESKSAKFAASGRTSSSEGDFAHTFNFFGEINTEESTFKALAREIKLQIIKKEPGFWDRLTEEPSKHSKNFLSCDWDLWKDEDDADDNPDFGMGDMGGMGGMGGMGMEGMDFSSMGGMGGMGGDSDDEEEGGPPDLEDMEPESSEATKENGAAKE
eukprot:NODE_4149_length_834_cov_48.407355_g3991_i0.p1 GENE.NODE_4149_length_834_cov_48.407355_g3991_i0~~NODE_4149_length_834_cov_48.407355_g3991_i0.p1  ORF type:complete len:187 (-),score=57.84 NODE_4149_length_834_cov_48.407355_g3991_i0:218-778(-)